MSINEYFYNAVWQHSHQIISKFPPHEFLPEQCQADSANRYLSRDFRIDTPENLKNGAYSGLYALICHVKRLDIKAALIWESFVTKSGGLIQRVQAEIDTVFRKSDHICL